MEKYFYKLFEIYLQTTNPKESYLRILKADVMTSILIHVILYVICFYLLTKVTNIKIKIDEKLIIGLFILMTFGYLGRLIRSKIIFKKFLKNNKEKLALEKTRKIINSTYLVWYFLG